MIKLCGFADEISPDLATQIKVCSTLGISHFELRGMSNKNVLDFDPLLKKEIKSRMADAGLGVICIGSPIGKVKITEPWDAHFDRFKIAVEMAEFFAAPLIRVFSYYPPEGGDIQQHRDEVMRRFTAKVDYLGDRPLTLVHENEMHIYGQGVAQCVDLMQTIHSPKLRTAFDFGNFVTAGEDPLKNWPLLKPYTVHIHVKDGLPGGKAVPAGEGVGHLAEILKDAYASGYDGFLSLEPHLAGQGQFSGFSGPDLFAKAANALKKVCTEIGVA